MKWSVRKSTLKGKVAVPPSKSHSIRALLFASMAEGTSTVTNLLSSPDVERMAEAMRQGGAQITGEKIVGSQLHFKDGVIEAGNSGQVLRFVGALAALGDKSVTITGDESLQRQRPVVPLVEGLTGLGAKVSSVGGRAPITVQGPIGAGKTSLPGEDSQPVSALLMAAAKLDGTTEIEVSSPGETAWIDLTLDWLKRMGVPCRHEHYERYWVEGGSSIPAFTYTVPGDWSAAAFPIVAALVTGSKVTIEGLDPSDVQGDRAIVDVLQQMGADISFEGKSVTVRGGQELQGVTIDINPLIDAVTILAVLACFASSPTTITNGAIARQKECDRLSCIALELKKMGADIDEREDGLIIRPSKLKGAKVKSCGCHRMAMSLAVAGMGAEGITEIEGVECAGKSFPHFDQVMREVGADIE